MSIDPTNLAATAVLTFDDEFNSLSLYNPTTGQGTWSTWFATQSPNDSGGSLTGNGEQEWYINSNYAPTSSVQPWTVSNGILTLTGAAADASIQPLINGYKYTSGEINTHNSFSQQYGYFEMRAQLPAGQGVWPAFWLVPEDGSWPPEIDAMEVLGNDPGKLYTTAHWGTAANEVSQGWSQEGVDLSAGYHTFGVDWEPDFITWYLDGKEYYQIKTPTALVNSGPMYMIANLALGGYWPGNVNSTTPFPAQMKIDYIRAYQANPNATAAAPPVDPGPGQMFQAVDGGSTLVGTAFDDTLVGAHGPDVMTGGAG